MKSAVIYQPVLSAKSLHQCLNRVIAFFAPGQFLGKARKDVDVPVMAVLVFTKGINRRVDLPGTASVPMHLFSDVVLKLCGSCYLLRHNPSSFEGGILA